MKFEVTHQNGGLPVLDTGRNGKTMMVGMASPRSQLKVAKQNEKRPKGAAGWAWRCVLVVQDVGEVAGEASGTTTKCRSLRKPGEKAPCASASPPSLRPRPARGALRRHECLHRASLISRSLNTRSWVIPCAHRFPKCYLFASFNSCGLCLLPL